MEKSGIGKRDGTVSPNSPGNKRNNLYTCNTSYTCDRCHNRHGCNTCDSCYNRHRLYRCHKRHNPYRCATDSTV